MRNGQKFKTVHVWGMCVIYLDAVVGFINKAFKSYAENGD